jgi:branched-chain amino acid transport system permease protein
MAAILGAIGLTILTGSAGQLSLAHAFFLAIGAYGYAYFAGASGGPGSAGASGLGLPSALAMVLAVLAAGVAGLLFSPISGRLRGIYLGVASLSLVFIGSFALENFTSITGGFNGRAIPDLSMFGFTFADSNPPLTVLNVPYGRFERLWYLSLVLVILGYVFAKNVLRGRPGRAMQTMRDSEVAAAVMGVNVRLTKAGAFVLSSMYAGLAGVLLSLVFTHVVPDYFNLALSVSYLAMVVIGGLGSVGGAALGAVFVSVLPQLLTRYSSSLPFVAQPGSGGYDPGVVSSLLYGVVVIVVVVFAPGGLAGLSRRLTVRRRQRPTASDPTSVPQV